MPGYFKVPMAAAAALATGQDGLDLLTGYIVLQSFAYGAGRNMTCAGANAIRKGIGCSDWRSKRIMQSLRQLRDPQSGSAWISPTGRKRLNAYVYEFAKGAGLVAYVPALLTRLEETLEGGTRTSPLRRLMDAAASDSVKTDALLLLLQLYARVDYAGSFGPPADYFPYQEWECEGERLLGDEVFELGQVGEVDGRPLWLVAPADDESGWTQPDGAITELLGGDPQSGPARFLAALDLLLSEGLVCKVAIVVDGRTCYPLWVSNPTYSGWLEKFGIEAQLARRFQAWAHSIGFDTGALYRANYGRDLQGGIGVYFCLGHTPVVRTVLAPCLVAPTPANLDGLNEVAQATQRLIQAGRRHPSRTPFLRNAF